MKCWECKQEMTVEYDNPWKYNKDGDRIRTTTYVCWTCRNILKLQATEVNIDDEIYVCHDDGSS